MLFDSSETEVQMATDLPLGRWEEDGYALECRFLLKLILEACTFDTCG